MDAAWFKQRQRRLGVTIDDIGAALGRERSIVSRIYAGRQTMTLDQARVFADQLQVPLADVLAHAGLTDPAGARAIEPGFSESDIAFRGRLADMAGDDPDAILARRLAGNRPADVWTVKGRALDLAGYMPGDGLLAVSASDRDIRAGDVVIAQVYDWTLGAARTVLRIARPPVLMTLSTRAEDTAADILDNRAVQVRARVIASWRRTATPLDPAADAPADGDRPEHDRQEPGRQH